MKYGHEDNILPLAVNFQVSCPELDALVEAAMEVGQFTQLWPFWPLWLHWLLWPLWPLWHFIFISQSSYHHAHPKIWNFQRFLVFMAVGWQAVALEVALWHCSSRWPMWPMNMARLWQYVTNVTIYVTPLWQYVTDAMWQYTWPPFDKKGPMRLTFYIFVTNLSIFHPVTNMTLCAINGHWSIILWKDVTNVTKLQQSAHYQNDQLLTSDVTNLTNLLW